MPQSIVRTFLMITLLAFVPYMGVISLSTDVYAQTTSDNSDLVARHQVRLDTVDSELRDLRGVLETDLRSLRIQLGQISDIADSADMSVSKIRRELAQEIARLDDTIEIMEQRLRRTIELSSDIEFRVLRLEKRMETLISLNLNSEEGNANTRASQTVNQNGLSDVDSARTPSSDTLAAGQVPSVVVSRDEDTGETVWTVNEAQLNSALQSDNTNSADNTNAADNTGAALADDQMNAFSEQDAASDMQDEAKEEPQEIETPAVPSVLPEGEPEAQFQFALNRALQRDFEVAEQAFVEFRDVNPDHSRAADSLFWLGRVQLMQGQYERSAMTFTTFNSEYPNDSRIVDTTLFIAESVSQFAEPEQACAIYASLPQLLDAPTDKFTKRIGELADSAGCN